MNLKELLAHFFGLEKTSAKLIGSMIEFTSFTEWNGERYFLRRYTL